MDFPGTEPQLNLRGVFIRLEGQRVFDIALRLERRRNSGSHASWASPSRVALTPSFRETTDASTVFPAAEG